MAKKNESPVGKFSFSKLTNIIENVSKKTSVMIDKGLEKSFISTGIYTLNALLSKSILKGGVQKNRITIFAGRPGVGKSYICYNIARNAQKDGYSILYIDTEFSIEKEDLKGHGIDISEDKLTLLRSNKIEDLKVLLAHTLDELKKVKNSGEEIPKFMIFLDSMGQMASNKEINDAIEGKDKQDMTRAKALKSMFRIITSDLGYLNIPMIVVGQVYSSQDLFPTDILSGGEGAYYSASVVVFLSIAKLKHGNETASSDSYVKDIGQSGVVVSAKAKKNRLAKPMTIKFEIDWDKGTNPYVGLEAFCTPENFDVVGIAQVKKEEDKKEKTIKYVAGGTKYYVKHLDKYLTEEQLYNGAVFNNTVLEALDPIIQEMFSYASEEERAKMLKEFEEKYTKMGTTEFEEEDEPSLF